MSETKQKKVVVEDGQNSKFRDNINLCRVVIHGMVGFFGKIQ